MTILEKIQIIFDEYKSIGAQLWNIDTDFYMSYKRLSQNILFNNYDEKPKKILINQVVFTEKSRFQIELNKKNITPTNNKLKQVSRAAIRQYLQIGSALSFINYSKRQKIEHSKSFDVFPSFYELTKYDFNEIFLNALINAMKRSILSSIYYEKNFGYSLFVLLINEYDDKIFSNIKNHKISLVRPRKKEFNYQEISVDSSVQYIKSIRYTYKTSCEKIAKKYKLDQIVNLLYEYLINDDNFSIEHFKHSNLLSNKLKTIDLYRSQIRRKTIAQRGCCDDNSLYSDLENSKNNYLRLKDLDACHIYDVEKIKLEVIQLINNGPNNIAHLEELAKNADNCLLMNPLCHRMFDRLEIWFDDEGKLCYREEVKEWVEMFFGENSNQVKIKHEIFNENMKKNLMRKISNKFNPIV